MCRAAKTPARGTKSKAVAFERGAAAPPHHEHLFLHTIMKKVDYPLPANLSLRELSEQATMRNRFERSPHARE